MAFVHNVNVLAQSLTQRRTAAQQQLQQREQQHQHHYQKHQQQQQPPHSHSQQPRPARVATAARRRPRMAALEAPVKEDLRSKLNNLLAQTVSETETENDKQRQKIDPGKMYKVLIYNDEVHSKDFVTKVLLKVIPGLTQDQAWRIMNEAHTNGRAIVGVWIFEISEGYCDMLRNNGLRSDIEEA